MNDLPNRVIDLAIQIQQIPAPTFAEGQRGEFVRDLFLKENLKDVSMDSLGNVYARLHGEAEKGQTVDRLCSFGYCLSSQCQLAGYPGQAEEAGKIVAPGIGDNSLGVASLFGILWSLRERKIELPHDVWFVANVGEEGLGDLRGMRGVVDRFDKNVIGYLVLEGLALGHVYHRAIGVRQLSHHRKNCGRTFMV